MPKSTPRPPFFPYLTSILIWGAVRTCCRIFSPFLFYFFAGDLQVDNSESPGCAHLIPSGRGEKHHSVLGILSLKMVICQLEQILGEQGRWRVDRFHLLYLLNLITGTGLQRGKNILLRVIWKEVENMVKSRQRQPPNHSVSLMLGIPASTTTFICVILLSYQRFIKRLFIWLSGMFCSIFSVPL